jgi:hypothetical protein
MNYVTVCGSGGGPEYLLGAVIGLAAVITLWFQHQRAATRAAARQILPLKGAAGA